MYSHLRCVLGVGRYDVSPITHRRHLDTDLFHHKESIRSQARAHREVVLSSRRRGSLATTRAASSSTQSSSMVETDVVIIGSGIGGLCCGALLAKYGYQVTVCEAHYHPGGAAHAFEVQGYTFDSGPSFFAGLSGAPGTSTNPLKQVLDVIDEQVECVTYDRWIVYPPEGGSFPCVCDGDEYARTIRRFGGDAAYHEWKLLEQRMAPLQKGASLFPAAAIRSDPGIILTAAKFGPALLETAFMAGQLTSPFSNIVDPIVKNRWLRQFLDLECFVLSGMLAKDTICAEMAFMFMERNSGTSTIDYPVGGAGAIVDALVRGIEKYGGKVLLSTPVDSILVEEGKATGVRVRKSKYPRTIRAKRAVISNASVWDTAQLLSNSSVNDSVLDTWKNTPRTGSFMHLHIGIDSSGLPEDLECHHLFVNSWNDLEAPQNVCIASIPSVFDPSLAPEGKAIIHAYTAGNEPWEIWENVAPGTPEYKQLKQERTQCLWHALEKVIPDVRARAEVVLEGSPRTHAKFLRRHKGTYGPAISAQNGSFPGPSTPIDGLYRCGDSCQPGIGVPAAAASGMISANTILPIWSHFDLIDSLGF